MSAPEEVLAPPSAPARERLPKPLPNPATLMVGGALVLIVDLALVNMAGRAESGAAGLTDDPPGYEELAASLCRRARFDAPGNGTADEVRVHRVAAEFPELSNDAEGVGGTLEPLFGRAREAGGHS